MNAASAIVADALAGCSGEIGAFVSESSYALALVRPVVRLEIPQT
jgi:hypothetical protein